MKTIMVTPALILAFCCGLKLSCLRNMETSNGFSWLNVMAGESLGKKTTGLYTWYTKFSSLDG
eukprot:bmy_02529T0